MARHGLLLLFAALFMAGPASARFLLGNTPSPATHPLVTFLQQASAKLAAIAALPPIPTSIQTAQAFFCQGRLANTQPCINALAEINRLNTEPPPIFSTVDPTAVIYVPKTHP